jgi:hypothetical protein
VSWAQLVDRERPDVVAVLLGRWECIDRLFDGRWTHVGEPAFDRHLVAELGQVIDIGSAHGAKVAMLTLPYIAQTTEQPDGSPWDMNLPSRTNAYNADVRRAVAEHPHQATVINLNKMLDPQGHYTSFIDGVRVRSFDDEHISTAGGQLLRSALLPMLVDLGLPTYRANLAHSSWQVVGARVVRCARSRAHPGDCQPERLHVSTGARRPRMSAVLRARSWDRP